jgi:hypothetical protein
VKNSRRNSVDCWRWSLFILLRSLFFTDIHCPKSVENTFLRQILFLRSINVRLTRGKLDIQRTYTCFLYLHHCSMYEYSSDAN